MLHIWDERNQHLVFHWVYFNRFQFNGFISLINPGFTKGNILHKIASFGKKEKNEVKN